MEQLLSRISFVKLFNTNHAKTSIVWSTWDTCPKNEKLRLPDLLLSEFSFFIQTAQQNELYCCTLRISSCITTIVMTRFRRVCPSFSKISYTTASQKDSACSRSHPEYIPFFPCQIVIISKWFERHIYWHGFYDCGSSVLGRTGLWEDF